MSLRDRFPPLYECSVCGAAVDVTLAPDGGEPRKKFSCDHTDAIIWANRKVTLRGQGDVNVAVRAERRLRLTLRQFLSALTGRSI